MQDKIDEYHFYKDDISVDEAAEAARRWNAYPELVEVAKEFKIKLERLDKNDRLYEDDLQILNKITALLKSLNQS